MSKQWSQEHASCPCHRMCLCHAGDGAGPRGTLLSHNAGLEGVLSRKRGKVVCQGNNWSCLRHEELVSISRWLGEEILPAVSLLALLTHRTGRTQSTQDPALSSTLWNRLQGTAPAHMGRGVTKHMYASQRWDSWSSRTPKQVPVGHNGCLRSHHTLWGASPWAQDLLNQTLLSCSAGSFSRLHCAKQPDSHWPYRDLDDPAHVGFYTAISRRHTGVRVTILSLKMAFVGWFYPVMYLLLLMDETGGASRLRFTS